jgi:hypothetical protein
VFRAGIGSRLPSVHGHDTPGCLAAGHLDLAARHLSGGLVQAQTAFSHGLHLLLATAALTAMGGAAAAFRYIRTGSPPVPSAHAMPEAQPPPPSADHDHGRRAQTQPL